MTLLAFGAVVSLGVLIWAVGQRPQAPTVAGQENDSGVQNESAENPTALDNDGRFTGPGEVWPPQPKNATDIVERTDPDLEPKSQHERLATLDAKAEGMSPSAVATNSPELQAALGDRANLVAVEEADGSTHMIWYSLANNQTIEATITGDAVASLTVHAAGDFQPELSNDEKQAAIDLARSHWQTRGDRRVDNLQGFSILAFQPGGAYYDTRAVYVSFHIDADERPELLTWVDLVTGEIFKSEVER